MYSKTATAIVDAIWKSLDSGNFGQWIKPWSADEGPHNHVTQRRYKGINTLICWHDQQKYGWDASGYLTFNQIKQLQSLGAPVKLRPGSVGTYILAWKRALPAGWKDLGNGNATNGSEVKPLRQAEYSLLRAHQVFNVTQVEGIQPIIREPLAITELTEEAKIIASEIGVPVEWKGDRCFYTPAKDSVTMATIDRFKSDADAAATLLHELVHASGHESRTNRRDQHKNGTPHLVAYAQEEITAEIGAAMLCNQLGILGKLQHEEYCASWAKAIKDEKHRILKAAHDAQAAVDWINQKVQAVRNSDLPLAAQ